MANAASTNLKRARECIKVIIIESILEIHLMIDVSSIPGGIFEDLA